MGTSAQASTMHGRHRWGRPGLIHVIAFVELPARRSLAAWLGLTRITPQPRVTAAHRSGSAHRPAHRVAALRQA
jgi:hypothetical protein